MPCHSGSSNTISTAAPKGQTGTASEFSKPVGGTQSQNVSQLYLHIEHVQFEAGTGPIEPYWGLSKVWPESSPLSFES